MLPYDLHDMFQQELQLIGIPVSLVWTWNDRRLYYSVDSFVNGFFFDVRARHQITQWRRCMMWGLMMRMLAVIITVGQTGCRSRSSIDCCWSPETWRRGWGCHDWRIDAWGGSRWRIGWHSRCPRDYSSSTHCLTAAVVHHFAWRSSFRGRRDVSLIAGLKPDGHRSLIVWLIRAEVKMRHTL